MEIVFSTSIRSESLAHAAETAHRMGFSALDVFCINGYVDHVKTSDLIDDWDRTVSRVDRLFDTNSVKPLSVNSGSSPQLHDRRAQSVAQRNAEIRAIVRFMKRFAIPIAGVQPRQADPTRPWSDVFRDCVETLLEYTKVAESEGVQFALEPHIGSPFESVAQVKQLREAIPEIPLIYDPSHFAAQGIDVRDTGWLLDRAVWVHLRDAARGALQTRFGEGEVDFPWIFNSLRARGYDGNFSIEYLERMNADIDDDVIRCRDAVLAGFSG